MLIFQAVVKGANRRLLPDLSTYGAYEFYLNLFFLLGIEGGKRKQVVR